MRSFRDATIALFVVGLAGCGGPPAASVETPPVTSAGKTEPGPSPSATPASAEDAQSAFVAAFKQASESKNVEAMLNLYCFDGVDNEMREVVRGNVQDELRQPATGFEFVAPDPAKHGPKLEGDVRWKPNLPIVTVVKVKFAPAAPGGGFAITDADYPLGMQGGQLKIALSVRE